MTQSNGILPILKAYPSDIASRVLVVGDPNRSYEASKLLEDAREVGSFREYLTFTGRYGGKLVSISSHGVGAAGASICFEELIKGGAKYILRAGTCGAMKSGINDGELIIGIGAIREDRTSSDLVPIEFPAISNRHIVDALHISAVRHGLSPANEGIVLTQSYFYDGIMPSAVGRWLESKMDVVCVEMELATLLVIASLRGIKASGIFVSDGNMTETTGPHDYNPHREVVTAGIQNMLLVALDALVAVA